MVNTVLAAKPSTATGGVGYTDTLEDLPTDAVATLAASILKCGYISEDGIEEETDRGTEDVTAWGGDVVRTLDTDHSLKYTLTFIEAGNLNLLRKAFGPANVTVDAEGNLSIAKTNYFPTRSGFVFDMIDQGKKLRIVIPNGQLVLSGSTSYAHGTVMQYEAEITCYPDEAGVKAWEYREDGATPVAP